MVTLVLCQVMYLGPAYTTTQGITCMNIVNPSFFIPKFKPFEENNKVLLLSKQSRAYTLNVNTKKVRIQCV